jgi:hypothetical protein
MCKAWSASSLVVFPSTIAPSFGVALVGPGGRAEEKGTPMMVVDLSKSSFFVWTGKMVGAKGGGTLLLAKLSLAGKSVRALIEQIDAGTGYL